MKIRKFKIQSYRSCQETELSITDDLTCLIGLNGAGKTNILNAVLLLKKIFEGNFLNKKSNEENQNICKLEIEFIFESKILFLKGDIHYDTDGQNNDYIIDAELYWNFRNFIEYSEDLIFPIEFFLNLDSFEFNTKFPKSYNEVDNEIILSSKNNKLSFSLPKLIDSKSLNIIKEINKAVYAFLNNINYYSATLFADPTKCPPSIEFEENRPQKSINTITVHEKFIIDIYILFKEKSAAYKKYMSIINNTGLGLVDELSFNEYPLPSNKYEVKSSNKIKDSKRLVIIPNFVINGVYLSPNQLSEGTFKTLALIYYILNDNSKLLLIEEPEVCVHHGLLNSIIELIKSESKNKQIIISTHSDYVLDKLKPENIILVKRNNGFGTVANTISESFSENDYNALKLYLSEAGNLGEFWKEGGFDNE